MPMNHQSKKAKFDSNAKKVDGLEIDIIKDPSFMKACLVYCFDVLHKRFGRNKAMFDLHIIESCTQPFAAFVTLRNKEGQLRGCRGNFDPKPLATILSDVTIDR